MTGPLSGLKVVEMAGIGPAPMCGMLLSDLGAQIIRIDRPSVADLGIERPVETNFILRGRKTIRVDVKASEGRDLALALIERADCLIEGFRPGVMERLGLGPEPCLARNPRLVFGRVTGWGQTGPMAPCAGHDINYIALTGALEAMGREGEPPPAPLNLIGDFAGGAMYLAIGLLAAVLEAKASGKGQVVDAAIVDGVAAMMTSLNGLRASGVFSTRRGDNILDSGAPYYDAYRCRDGRHIAVGAIEKRFYGEFLARLGFAPDDLPPQSDRARWPEGRAKLAALFATRDRDDWAAVFAGSDACVTPVLSLEESFHDPHMTARESYVVVNGRPQARPGPRMSRATGSSPAPPAPPAGREALDGWLPATEIERLGGAVL